MVDTHYPNGAQHARDKISSEFRGFGCLTQLPGGPLRGYIGAAAEIQSVGCEPKQRLGGQGVRLAASKTEGPTGRRLPRICSLPWLGDLKDLNSNKLARLFHVSLRQNND